MPSFVDGQKVDARFRGKAKYFPGTIMKDNGDGTYEIRYDDGDTEKQVKESLIRSAGGSAAAKLKSAGGSAPMEDALIGTWAVKDYHRPWHGRIFRDGEGRLRHFDSDHPSHEGCYLNVEPDGSIKFLMHKDGGQIHTGQYRQETDEIHWSDGDEYIRRGGGKP